MVVELYNECALLVLQAICSRFETPGDIGRLAASVYEASGGAVASFSSPQMSQVTLQK